MSYERAETLTGVIFAPLDWARALALVVAFSLLTALAAQFAVPLPFTPVPITAQTFVVLLAGALLGSRLGALAMILYLLEGAGGLPFFAGGQGGAAYLLLSPTAGYLFSYPAAAFAVGFLAERGWDRRFATAALAMAAGATLILVSGWAWYSMIVGSVTSAFVASVAPFIVGEVVKLLLGASLLPMGWKLLGRCGGGDRAMQRD
ncbi:MAG: biotin transporter BioY [Pyrinomonadaceae bacterium]|nr:biotin transporter BioY [Pyrinomonadaceae bacterium]